MKINKCKCNWLPSIGRNMDPIWGYALSYYVYCEKCGYRGQILPTEEEAIIAWNKEQEIIDKLSSIGCTSFMLTPDEIKQLEFADENDLMDECYQKIIEAGGCPSSVLNEEEYKNTDDYIKDINRTLTYLNTLPPPIKYIKVKSKFYKQLAKMHPSISSSEVEGIRAKLTGIPIVIDDEIENDYEPVY